MSSEDLTQLVVAKRQRDADIEEGIIDPYAPIKLEEDSHVKGKVCCLHVRE